MRGPCLVVGTGNLPRTLRHPSSSCSRRTPLDALRPLHRSLLRRVETLLSERNSRPGDQLRMRRRCDANTELTVRLTTGVGANRGSEWRMYGLMPNDCMSVKHDAHNAW